MDRMDPNKRGNPPFEPSSYAAGLERRVARATQWQHTALACARRLLDGPPDEREVAEAWWRAQLNPVEVVLASPTSEITRLSTKGDGE